MFGLALALAVVAPWMGGRVLLLDWVTGPAQRLVPPSAYGLGGGLSGGLPLELFANAVSRVLGAPTSWLLPAAVFPLATTSIARLVRGSTIRQITAAALFALNPFVFERLYVGQIGVLLGYALLPRAVIALNTCVAPGRAIARVLPAALWCALLVALSPHYAWILVPIAAAAVLTAEHRTRALALVVTTGAAAALMSAYALATPLLVRSRPAKAINQLAAYRTRADPHVGLLANVIGLYGFWRPGPIEPKQLDPMWILVLAVILALAALGYDIALTRGHWRRPALTLLFGGLGGLLLALGNQGPLGGVYQWAVLQVPGFAVMREAEKFSSLVALAYAVGFGWGIEYLAQQLHKRTLRKIVGLAAVAVVFAYTPNLVGGLGGQVDTTVTPRNWSEAAALLSRHSLRGAVLVFPWHAYLALPGTGGRTVANAAADLFPGDVLTGNDAGPGYDFAALGPTSQYLASYVTDGPGTADAGSLLAPLGIEYVVLEKIDDWRSYGWLNAQQGLRLIMNRSNVAMYEVSHPLLRALRVPGLRAARSPASLVISSAPAHLVATTRLRGPALSYSRPSQPSREMTASLREISPTDYRIGPGRPGWAIVPLPYAPGWKADGQPAIALADGDMAVRVSSAATMLSFGPWPRVLAAELVSAATVLLATGLVLRRRWAHPGLD